MICILKLSACLNAQFLMPGQLLGKYSRKGFVNYSTGMMKQKWCMSVASGFGLFVHCLTQLNRVELFLCSATRPEEYENSCNNLLSGARFTIPLLSLTRFALDELYQDMA